MAKPSLLTVDDDPEVLRAVERDLRRKYGKDYRVLGAKSGEEGLHTLEQLKLRNDPLALMLVDQRMPGMSGVEFLEQAKELVPDAKKVLLTAYADTNAAIDAINKVRLDYYVQKPWDPPEDRLFPVLDDLLYDWSRGFVPPDERVRVVGHRWSAETHRVNDYLARNRVPYRWLDVEVNPEAAQLLEAADAEDPKLPLVVLTDGRQLEDPTNVEVADAVGLREQLDTPYFDLIIVGGGPAGLAAAVYGASEGLTTCLVEREATGGQAGQSSRIENYLGFPSGLSGSVLAERAVAQARRFGVRILTPAEVTGVRVKEPYRVVDLADGTELSCKALVVSTGVSYRRLDVPGEKALYGAGVYYGAAQTEAINCEGEDVYIVGGANSAGQAAMWFSKYASCVHVLVRGDSLSKGMSSYLVKQIADTPNIVVDAHTVVAAVSGTDHLETVTVRDTATGEEKTVGAQALCVFIGAEPRTEWLEGVVQRDERGFLLTGPEMRKARPKAWPLPRDPYLLETSLPGVFAVGDVRAASVKRVASAVGEGSIAVSFVHQYLTSL